MEVAILIFFFGLAVAGLFLLGLIYFFLRSKKRRQDK